MASAVRSVGGAVAKAVHTLRVGVVGAGTAGPATALLLAQAGHRISLMDRTPELAPVGAGIGVRVVTLPSSCLAPPCPAQFNNHLNHRFNPLA